VRDGVTGYHVPNGDHAALCEKLNALLGDAELRRNLGRNAAEYAQDYAWEKIASKIVGVYTELMGATAQSVPRHELS
jgi:glycosyltransferase involved in cell wall biosynthesis